MLQSQYKKHSTNNDIFMAQK